MGKHGIKVSPIFWQERTNSVGVNITIWLGIFENFIEEIPKAFVVLKNIQATSLHLRFESNFR